MPDPESPSRLGEIIRRQRELHEMSMREFAEAAGISNPYLSQIERGHREPSNRVVDAIARTLQTSADALYAQAGLGPMEDGQLIDVRDVLKSDRKLTPRQRRVMIEIYETFLADNTGLSPRG